MSVIKSHQQHMGPRPAQAPAATATVDGDKLRQLTEKLAYELYEKGGRAHGRDREDWVAAETAARAHLSTAKA